MSGEEEQGTGLDPADGIASKVGEFFRTLFRAGDPQSLLLVVVEVARVARSRRLRLERRLHLSDKGSDKRSEVGEVADRVHVLWTRVERAGRRLVVRIEVTGVARMSDFRQERNFCDLRSVHALVTVR